MTGTKWAALVATASALALGAAACGSSDDDATGNSSGDLSGSIRIDGSSTVAPLTEAIAEEFEAENSDVRVT
ncbi:MAG TPA: phosphate ABC transporter substrate-binding protein, partial [Solirubrobacterales bacterium]|nr:phosphate ABC transporter substrate-binding protein [Solirubrobacterales bacterium]